MDPNAGTGTTGTNNQPTTGQEPPATAPTTNPPANPPAAPATGAKTPDWYEAELKKVREEAASWRTKLREAESKNAPTPEDLAARIAELEKARTKAERDALVATIGRDLPDDLLEELRESNAKTEEELKAKAEKFRKYAQATGKQAPPEKLGGGLNPGGGSGDEPFDAAKAVREIRARRG